MQARGIAIVIVIVALASGCGGGGLKGEDPRGFEACQHLEEFEADRKVDLDENLAIGLAASSAITRGIRDTAKATFSQDDLAAMRRVNPKVEQIYFVNREGLRAACADAGYKFGG